MMTDARARTISSSWHSSTDATYQFTSTGTINPDVRTAFVALATANPNRGDLALLITYLAAHPGRPPQKGWSELWEEPASLACPFCGQLERWTEHYLVWATSGIDVIYDGTTASVQYDGDTATYDTERIDFFECGQCHCKLREEHYPELFAFLKGAT